MKYVILIHSNPEPWGHPTDRFTAEGRAMPESYHAEAESSFDKLMTEIEEDYALLASRVNTSVSTYANRIEPRVGNVRWTLLTIFVIVLFFVVLGSGFVFPRPRKPRDGLLGRIIR